MARRGRMADRRNGRQTRKPVAASGTARLDRLLARHPIPDWRLPAAGVTALLIGAAAWAWVAEFDEVVIAQGEVVPRGQVKTVQHLEGGIIDDLLVVEGDRVTVGDPLILLDPTRVGATVEALRAELDGLQLRRARLIGETRGEEPDYPRAAGERLPAVLAAERRSHADRQAQLASSLAVVREQIRQRDLEVRETEALLEGLRETLEVNRERLELSASLLVDDLTPRMEHLQIEERVEELKSGVAQTEAALPRASAALAEAQEREREAGHDFRRLASEQLAETEVEIASRQEMLVAARDQAQRSAILAPIDGVVQNMRHHTVGGVIRPGEPIMDLVPANDRLLIEAQVDPRDIGHIETGMRATVKITAYDFIRYGGLDATVVRVAADANRDDTGWHYFRVAVETDRTALGDAALPIIPGMLATVDIHTGTRRVSSYLAGPVLRMRYEAFRER